RRRLPAGRQAAPQGGPPSLPARVHLRGAEQQVQDPRGRPQGEDARATDRLQVRLSVSASHTPNGAPASDGGGAVPILRTEGLTVRFGGLTALNNVNVSVRPGEIRAVIGPNGAGKSTFFNCLTGVIRPSGGRIVFDGDDITGLSPDWISRKAMARSYQITNILPGATVLENVRIAAQSRRHGWSMLRHHRAYVDVIERARAV